MSVSLLNEIEHLRAQAFIFLCICSIASASVDWLLEFVNR